MIRVTIELWPGGSQANKRTIGIIDIANDGTGSEDLGNYKVGLHHAGKYFGKAGFWRRGEVRTHNRALSPYHLLLKALQAALHSK